MSCLGGMKGKWPCVHCFIHIIRKLKMILEICIFTPTSQIRIFNLFRFTLLQIETQAYRAQHCSTRHCWHLEQNDSLSYGTAQRIIGWQSSTPAPTWEYNGLCKIYSGGKIFFDHRSTKVHLEDKLSTVYCKCIIIYM